MTPRNSTVSSKIKRIIRLSMTLHQLQ